jgi:protein-S-isoprenylcysteine O-methyltransferase Ste14
MAENKDNPGVIAPPPLIALAAMVLGLALDWLLPAYVLATLLSLWTRIALGVALMLAGAALAIAALRRFAEARTPVNPTKAVISLATSGVYHYARNPMYVALLVTVGGIGVALASDWTLVMEVPLALVLRDGVVLREERYLEAKFGDEYRRYKASVPRWGIW